MVECFNGSLRAGAAFAAFQQRRGFGEDIAARFVGLLHQRLPQKELKHETSSQVLKRWEQSYPHLLLKSVRNDPRPDLILSPPYGQKALPKQAQAIHGARSSLPIVFFHLFGLLGRLIKEIKISVPFIDLKRLEPGFHAKLMEKFQAMTLGAQFIGGAEVAVLESRLQQELQVSHAVTCANGTDALQLALRAIGVGEGDLVLVPNVTFWATFEAVVNVGAKPVTVDADLSDGGVCFEAFEQAIRETKPKAALVAHLYGWGSARLLDLRTLCQKHGVALVEDGAQSFGVRHQGEPIYKGAHISTTSFYPAKVLGGAGDGGAVFTDDAGLAEKVRQLGNHGRTAHYGYGNVGWNSRLDSLQAAFLNLALDHIEVRIASRLQAVAFYREKLPVTDIQLMDVPAGYTENGYCNVCLVPDPARKAALEAALKAEGIGFGNIYPSVMSSQPGAATYLKGHFGGQIGEQLCASVLNLPLFPYMTKPELQRVVDVVETNFGGTHAR